MRESRVTEFGSGEKRSEFRMFPKLENAIEGCKNLPFLSCLCILLFPAYSYEECHICKAKLQKRNTTKCTGVKTEADVLLQCFGIEKERYTYVQPVFMHFMRTRRTGKSPFTYVHLISYDYNVF